MFWDRKDYIIATSLGKNKSLILTTKPKNGHTFLFSINTDSIITWVKGIDIGKE
jgi:hypothetical protein